jgi:hypothetical protein
VFMTASFDAGSVMVRVRRRHGVQAERVWDMHGRVELRVRPSGAHVRHRQENAGSSPASPDGKEVWSSDGKAAFEMGSYLLADGMFFALEAGPAPSASSTPTRRHTSWQAQGERAGRLGPDALGRQTGHPRPREDDRWMFAEIAGQTRALPCAQEALGS